MRYVILNNKISKEEIKSRKKYIENVSNLYFILNKIDGGIEFNSIPPLSIDCLFIVGHNMHVHNYLNNNNIPEKNIVIVSCYFPINKKQLKENKVFVSHDEDGKTDFFDGTDWNLNFNVSKEELKLINSSGSFMERVKKYFRRVK